MIIMEGWKKKTEKKTEIQMNGMAETWAKTETASAAAETTKKCKTKRVVLQNISFWLQHILFLFLKQTRTIFI